MSRECEATEKNREEFRILKVRVRQARTPNFRFLKGARWWERRVLVRMVN